MPWARKIPAILLTVSVFAFLFSVEASRRGAGGVILLVIILLVIMTFLYPQQRRATNRPRGWRRSEHARLGADGIALGDDDFVRYQDIVALESSGDRLVLDVGRSDPVVLALSPADRAAAEAAIDRGRHPGLRVAVDDAALETTLRRGNEGEAEWRARIDALRVRVAYRTVDLDRSSLWRVAEDVAADPSARVAACGLLSRVVDPKEHETLLSMHANTAHPGLRDALEAMEKAAEEVDATAPDPTRKSGDMRVAG
jgi:hypothetical protein